MLSIHVLNVNHGDSIVIEHHDEGLSSFAVVDSNMPKGAIEPPALRKLRELGAQRLNFVALTHPHFDHYLGLAEVMEAYQGRVDQVFTFPLLGHEKKIAEIYQAKLALTDGESIAYAAEQFIKFLFLAKKCEWDDPDANSVNWLMPPGFQGVRISSILPPAKQKGEFFQSLVQNKFQPEFGNETQKNELSLALMLEYRGHRIILGGDGTYDNFVYQSKRLTKAKQDVYSTAVKLPHHGSRHDCDDLVLNMLYDQKGAGEEVDRFACISADGKSHPAPEVIDSLVRRKVKPYCTNLAKRCGGNLTEMLQLPNTNAAMARFIHSVAARDATSRSIQPCQGDITIKIDDAGILSVIPQHNHPCAYRGDFNFLTQI